MNEIIIIDLDKLQNLFNDGDAFKVLDNSIIRYWQDGCNREHEQDKLEFKKITNLKEKIANQIHEQWIDWMKHLKSKSTDNEFSYNHIGQPCQSFDFNNRDINRWINQMNTPYSELTEKEKDSDRKLANKILEILKNE